MRNYIKDLLYTTGNQALDIARTATAASLGAFWAGVYTGRISGDALAVGGGCAAIFAAGCAWIHFRQKNESGTPDVAGTGT